LPLLSGALATTLSLAPGMMVNAPATAAARSTAEIDGTNLIDITHAPDRLGLLRGLSWG
jgi:hypothetical protein